MKLVVMAALLVCFVFALGFPALSDAPTEGLAAHYKFDEESGNIALDSSGNGANGNIIGAKRVKVAGGHALDFDGISAHVDCGTPASLDIRGPITLSAWVCPAGLQYALEPGIIGKQFSSYLITYYLNRQIFWYVNSGGNSVKGTVLPSSWSHVTTTFDGKDLKLYINGELAVTRASRHSAVNPGGRFTIGMVKGDTEAVDPSYQNTSAFRGLIDEVRVYNRALSAEEAASLFSVEEQNARNTMFTSPCTPVKAAQTIQGGTASVEIGENGGLQMSNGDSFFVLNSAYSYPGKEIGWNALSETAEPGWNPLVERVDATTLSVSASGNGVSLKRTVRLRDGRVEIDDTLTNTREEPAGIVVKHELTAPEVMGNTRVCTTADNPVIFFAQNGGDFGFLAEDDIGRLQFEAAVVANTARLTHSSLALDAGKSHTFRYVVYPLKGTGDVYEFINRVRNDWKSNFTVEGPCYFFDMDPGSILWNDQAIRKYLERKPLKIVMLSPWLDYDPGSMDRVITREEYKDMAVSAAKILRGIDPEIKVIGCIEADWVTLYPEQIPGGQALHTCSPEEFTRILDAADIPWKDSVKRNVNGHMAPERYVRGGKPQLALAVYQAPGNSQHKFLMEQAEFLMDECGLDGFYIDEFNQAWSQSIRDYSRWDGYSADIHPATGELMRKYTNCSLVGIPSRVDIINSALKRGKVIVANTYATSMAEQSLPAQRFWETMAFQDISLIQPGVKPPVVYELTQGLLASPIALGVTANPAKPDLAEGLMLGLISYLRHGLVYYHYWYPEVPESGPGSGDYGPINHMFPFTPVEIREGWMKGKERILAARSFETTWETATEPIVRLFDLHGREVPADGKANITGGEGLWNIKVNMNDWAEIVVVE